MGRDATELAFGLVGTAVIVFGLLIAAAIITPLFLLGIAVYVAVRLWYESPTRLERLAYEETMQLYRHAQAGRVVLSDDELDAYLLAAWPPIMPEALSVQLLEVARALFDMAGLNPEIPPIPALYNTVEGGQYRDLLARLGQARNDRQMLLAVLRTISDALAPIAKAAPPMEGDSYRCLSSLHPLAPPLTPLYPPSSRTPDTTTSKLCGKTGAGSGSRGHEGKARPGPRWHGGLLAYRPYRQQAHRQPRSPHLSGIG
ncbi:hypothetical protein [uncultured Tateyamaria sp.]|uniref:hypothetical protein n=1 Tax=uncultured Tateyamaria sp. TaxID=455651 RepID=UPI00260D21C3|nr:hypothetical protein [uncultured Tateyamaria sp.]